MLSTRRATETSGIVNNFTASEAKVSSYIALQMQILFGVVSQLPRIIKLLRDMHSMATEH